MRHQKSDEFLEIVGGEATSIHDLIIESKNNMPLSQLDAIRQRNIIRVVVLGKKAYWVHNNMFYEADVVDGEIDNEGAKTIDVFNLTEKELDNLLEILDHIRS